MPIELPVDVVSFDQEQFHQIDRTVLGVAFSVHNEFGRFLDEAACQEEIAFRCREFGLRVERELRIRVVHGSFARDCFVDLFVDRGVVVEIKTAESLTAAHQSQVLNYLYLTGTQHGSLINLRPSSVKREFVSTSLETHDRLDFQTVDIDWQQDVHFLTSDVAFAFSAVTKDRRGILEHQRRFLEYTDLQAIAWVNLNRHNIEFTTIQK